MPFIIDAGGDAGVALTDVPQHARTAEALGADGLTFAETKHDPFVAMSAAALSTSRIQLFSTIVVAFARNPMTVAMAANDVHLLSGGRLVLGLGSQVQAHIERRFSMPWSQPAARMREFVEAVRAIWLAWETGERLRFRGEHYTHTLMAPFFDPGPNPYGNPEVWVAAVGPKMAEAAGAVADGVVAHTFTTPAYLREVTIPALERGAAGGRRPGIALPAFIAMGEDAASIRRSVEAVARQIAFYASTPSYLPVMELHGWGAQAERLSSLARRQDWAGMAEIVDEEMVREFAVVGTPQEVAAGLVARFDGLVDRLSFSAPYEVPDEQWRELFRLLRG